MGENQSDHDLLITLNQKIDNITKCLEAIPLIENRVRNLEVKQGIQGENLEIHKTEIDKLRNTNTIWSTFNSIFVLIGSFLGIAIK